jgi:hypothetical protein
MFFEEEIFAGGRRVFRPETGKREREREEREMSEMDTSHTLALSV